MSQHMTALAQANEVRYAQARWKNEIAALPRVKGKAFVAFLLANPDEDVARMRVEVLLGAIRGFGSRSSIRSLHNAFIPVGFISRRVGPVPDNVLPDGQWLCLSARQRAALAEELLR